MSPVRVQELAHLRDHQPTLGLPERKHVQAQTWSGKYYRWGLTLESHAQDVTHTLQARAGACVLRAPTTTPRNLRGGDAPGPLGFRCLLLFRLWTTFPTGHWAPMTVGLGSPPRASSWFLGCACEQVQCKEKSLRGVEGRALRTPILVAGGGNGRRQTLQVNASCDGGDGVTDKRGGVVKTGEGVSRLRVMESQVCDSAGVCFSDGEGQTWCRGCV